jgi:hypothetical protein
MGERVVEVVVLLGRDGPLRVTRPDDRVLEPGEVGVAPALADRVRPNGDPDPLQALVAGGA